MIKEIKINCGKNVAWGVANPEGLASNDLVSLISKLDQCVEQYCIVIDVVENNYYSNCKQYANNFIRLLTELTKRESEILRLAIQGLSNKEICDNLCISLETVKSHRKKIVSKIGIRKINDFKDIMLKANLVKVI